MNTDRSPWDLAIMLDSDRDLAREGRDTFPGMKSTDRAPREVILHRAYAIWQSEGYPENRQLANWLEAEAEVMSRGRT